jgi:hypothetical protein
MRHRPLITARSRADTKRARDLEDAARVAVREYLAAHPGSTKRDCLAHLEQRRPDIYKYFGRSKSTRLNIMNDLYAGVRRQITYAGGR